MEVALKLTPLNQLMNNSISLNFSHEPLLIGWMVIFSLVLGLLSGAYPALYLSAIKPLSALINGHQAGKRSILLRQSLVLVQFIVSVTVIACTLLMAMQMQYISNKSLGYNKENKLIVTLRGGDMIEKVPIIKTELLKNNSILGITISSHLLVNTPSIGIGIDNNNNVPESVSANYMTAGDDFIKVMGMKLVTGRDFSGGRQHDTETSYIVNESLVKKMGWKEPLGKRIHAGDNSGKVIGVVKDFNYASLKNKIGPFLLRGFNRIDKDILSPIPRPNMIYYMTINISGDRISKTLYYLKKKFEEFDPQHPFEFEFMDKPLGQLYFSEHRLMKLVSIFSAVCIFISCLGLFGLAAFTTEQRTKEIGIRKVLGASTWGIIAMLSNRILLLVLGGAVVASLIAWYAMDEWLTGFAYHTNIDLWVFLVSAAVAAGVAFVTIALQSYKTAHEDPVKALRYE